MITLYVTIWLKIRDCTIWVIFYLIKKIFGGLILASCSEIIPGKFRNPCGIPGIESGLTILKANALLAVLLLQPPILDILNITIDFYYLQTLKRHTLTKVIFS